MGLPPAQVKNKQYEIEADEIGLVYFFIKHKIRK